MAILIGALYVLGVVVATWPMYQRMERWGEPQSFTNNLFLGVCAALCWPIVVAALLSYHASRAIWGAGPTTTAHHETPVSTPRQGQL